MSLNLKNQALLILDILFPKKCVGCGRFGSFFCQDCIRNILQSDLVCPKCEDLAVGGQTHPICKRRYGLDGLWSLGVYQGSLRSAIQQLKYKGVKELADVLADITCEYWARYQPFLLEKIKKSYGKGWVVTAVPLSWYRNNWRGFNQSELLAKSLAKKLGLEYVDVLKRIKYTKSQVKLSEKERQQNIRGAFEISNNQQPMTNNYLLVDDVWTTGSTLRECCYILKRAGAKQVWALTLAR